MSHAAMNWALEQKYLKPAAWIVLIQLADRHNKDTLRLDPDQALIARDCNMSRASINRHLSELEALGLLQRVQRVNPATGVQLKTFYILGLDFANPPHIEFAVSQIATRENAGQKENIDATVSQIDTRNPCLKNEQSRVSKNDNPVSQIETLSNPVREPLREPCGAQPDLAKFDDFAKRLAAVYPRAVDLRKVASAFGVLVASGDDPEAVIAAAVAYAIEQRGNVPRFVALAENWLGRGDWRRFVVLAVELRNASALPSEAEINANFAAMINGNKFLPPSAISPRRARSLLGSGLVTPAQLQHCGVIS